MLLLESESEMVLMITQPLVNCIDHCGQVQGDLTS